MRRGDRFFAQQDRAVLEVFAPKTFIKPMTYISISQHTPPQSLNESLLQCIEHLPDFLFRKTCEEIIAQTVMHIKQ